MTKQEQIEEMAKEIEKAKQHIWASVRTQAEDEDYLWHSRAIAEHLTSQGYRKIDKDSIVLSREEYEKLKQYEEKVENGACFTQKEWLELCDEEYKRETENLSKVRQLERKETAREILQKVVNICIKEEYFQDGTVNTQLEPLYFGIMNGCAFVRGEVKELAKQYGVEVEE